MYLDFFTKDMQEYFQSNFDLVKAKPFKRNFYESPEYGNLVIMFRNHNIVRLEEYKNAITTLNKTLSVIKKEFEKEQ